MCVYDYLTTLQGIPYPSEEYFELRRGCHERSANRILYMALTCGGIYFKGGQYIGTLEKLMPQEYPDALRVLQDRAP